MGEASEKQVPRERSFTASSSVVVQAWPSTESTAMPLTKPNPMPLNSENVTWVRSTTPKRTLDSDKLLDVAQMTSDAEMFAVGKLWCREQFLKNLQRASLMGHHFGSCGIGSHRRHLHRQCADIDTDVGHRGFRCARLATQARNIDLITAVRENFRGVGVSG